MNSQDISITTEDLAKTETHTFHDRIFRRVKRGQVPYLFLAPTMILLIIITLFPVIYSFILSLQNYNLADPLGREFVWFNQYGRALSSVAFWHTMWVTAIFTIITVGVEFVLGFGTAMLLTREGLRGTKFITILLIIPMMITPVVAGLLWKALYNPFYGVINYLLAFVGLADMSWISQSRTALISVALVDIWEWTPFMILLFTAGLYGMPKAVFEAAKVDGASSLRIFYKLTIPLMKPLIQVALLIRLIDALRIFDIIYVLTKGGPGNASESVSIHIYLRAFQELDIGYAAAVSFILLIIIIVFCKIFIGAFERVKKAAVEIN